MLPFYRWFIEYQRKERGTIMKKKILAITLLAFMLLGACSAKPSDYAMGQAYATTAAAAMSGGALNNEMSYDMADGSMVTSAPMAAPQGAAEKGYGGAVVTNADAEGQQHIDDGRKLIRTGSYDLETMDFPKTIQEIEALVNSVNGYVQNSSQSGGSALYSGYQSPRSAHFVLRVPADYFFTVGKALGDIATVLNSNHSVSEVTDIYYDTEARLKTLRVQEERLLTLMSQATELEAIILLESTLSNVRYEIESYEGSLRRLDSQIGYSTLTVNVQEVFAPTVIEQTPVTLGQRIASRFRSTLGGIERGFENLLVTVLGDGLQWIINLAVMAIIVLGGWKIVRVVKKRLTKKPRPEVKAEDENKPE